MIETYTTHKGTTVEAHLNENGKLHRTDGPAEIEYNAQGQVIKETWCINGEVHRVNGPAIIEYNDQGEITKQENFNNGIYFGHFFNDFMKIGRVLSISERDGRILVRVPRNHNHKDELEKFEGAQLLTKSNYWSIPAEAKQELQEVIEKFFSDLPVHQW